MLWKKCKSGLRRRGSGGVPGVPAATSNRMVTGHLVERSRRGPYLCLVEERPGRAKSCANVLRQCA